LAPVLEESEHEIGGNRCPTLIIAPGSEWQIEVDRQHWPAMFAVEILTSHQYPDCQQVSERLPIVRMIRTIHRAFSLRTVLSGLKLWSPERQSQLFAILVS
jgi:hypothetical protein